MLTDKAYVQQLAEFLPNIETGNDFRLNTETALVAPISRAFAVKVAYTIHFDNLPEPGFKKTDRVLSSGIQVTHQGRGGRIAGSDALSKGPEASA